MDRAVYDMGALEGAQWLRARIDAGKLADIHELLQKEPPARMWFADIKAKEFGLSARAGGMRWDHYKQRAYGVGWLAGVYTALVEATKPDRLLDALVTGMPL
jgi:hypothetical protein